MDGSAEPKAELDSPVGATPGAPDESPAQGAAAGAADAGPLMVPLPSVDDLRPLHTTAMPTDLDSLQALLAQFIPTNDFDLDGLASALDILGAEFESKFYSGVLPFIIEQARRLPDLFPDGIALLHAGEPGLFVASRAQALCLVANMFLCTFDVAFGEAPAKREQGRFLWVHQLPDRSMLPLLSAIAPQEVAKLVCIVHYFGRMLSHFQEHGAAPPGHIYIRRLAGAAVPAAVWADSEVELGEVEVLNSGGIEDADGCLQADFANAYLGGGVLSGGCVQEEIRFAVCPELLIGCLVAPRMQKREAIIMTGAEQFSAYKGYAFRLQYGGDHVDTTPRVKAAATPEGAGAGAGAGAAPAASTALTSDALSPGTVLTRIVAIDAVHFRMPNVQYQLVESRLVRELTKAFIGFSCDDPECTVAACPVVATGNWGCGAFNGNHHIKAMLQWMAASQAGRRVRYYTFGDRKIAGLQDFVVWARANSVTVGEVWRALAALSELYGTRLDLFHIVREVVAAHRDGRPPSPSLVGGAAATVPLAPPPAKRQAPSPPAVAHGEDADAEAEAKAEAEDAES